MVVCFAEYGNINIISVTLFLFLMAMKTHSTKEHEKKNGGSGRVKSIGTEEKFYFILF